MVVLALYLALAPKPWEVQVAATIADGGKVALEDFVADGLWWASLVNLLLLGGLLATAGWWLRPLAVPAGARRNAQPWVPSRRIVLILLLGISALALVERLPRLGLSLWNDEEYSLRRYVLGYTEARADGELRFKPVEWRETFFFNRGANNHIPFSISAKLSLGVWRLFAAEEGRQFAEWAYRLPALLAGLASVFAIGWLVARNGAPVAGLASALAFALHPWHIRYSVEARGYSIMLLALVLALLFAALALGSGRWRHWLAFGGCQFVMLWAFPGAVYLAVVMNAGLLACTLAERPFVGRGLPQLLRLAVANLLAAAAFIQVMGPSLRQIQLYLARDIAQGAMGPGWFLDIGAHLFAGVRYALDDPQFPQYLSLQHIPGFAAGGGAPIALALAALTLAGLARATLLGRAALLATATPLAAALLAYLHTRLTGNFLFSWYLLYALAGLIPAVMLGAEQLARLIAIRRGERVRAGLAALCCAAFVLPYALATTQTREFIKHVPRQPLRESISVARLLAPEATLAVYGVSSRQFASYEPALVPIDEGDTASDLELLESLIAQARSSPRDLIVLFSGGRQRKQSSAEFHQRLARSGEFGKRATLRGLEDFFEVEVWMFKDSG